MATRLDPRTGYKYEPWHLRYVGTANAAAFETARVQSVRSGRLEITLEQWLRERHNVVDPAALPVCDGCNCGECATLHDPQSTTPSPCGTRGLFVGVTNGGPPRRPLPALVDALARTDADGTIYVTATVDVPEQVVTQTPVVNAVANLRPVVASPLARFEPTNGISASREYAGLARTIRLGIAHHGDAAGFSIQVALAEPRRSAEYNGTNLRLLASHGHYDITVPIRGLTRAAGLRVALVRDGLALENRVIVIR